MNTPGSKHIPALTSQAGAVLMVPKPEVLLGGSIPVKVPDGAGGETDGDAGVNLAMTRATLPEGVDVLLPAWVNMNVDDQYSIYWADTNVPAFTDFVKPGEVDHWLTRKVPISFVIGSRPEEPHVDEVYFVVARMDGSNPDTSPIIKVLVKITLPGGRDTDAGLPGHQGLRPLEVSRNPINDPADTSGVDLTIPPYVYMRIYDKVTVAWGSVQVEHTVTASEVGRPLVIHLTHQQILSAGDSPRLQVVYKVMDEVQNQSNDADNRPWSTPTRVDVELDPTRPLAPYFEGFTSNVIDLAKLGTANLQIRLFLDPGVFEEDDLLDVTWSAQAVDGSALAPITHTHTVKPAITPTPVIQEIPAAEVRKAAEGRVQVNYLHRRIGKISKSLNGTITGLLEKLPAPQVDEADGNGVIAPTLPFATIRITAYDGFKEGDNLTITWTGITAAGVPISEISNRTVTAAEDIAKVLTQQVPSTKILPLAGRPVTVTYLVNAARESEKRVLQVANLGEEPVFPAPTVVQANSNNVLNPMDATAGARVEVRYDTMLGTDTITLTWVGGTGAGTPIIASQPGNASSKMVAFTVPASAVGACVGRGVTVGYQVRTAAGTTPSTTLPLTVSVIAAGELPLPRLPVAAGDILNLDTLTADPFIEIAPWPFIAAGQRLWLELRGRVNGQPVTRRLINGTEVTLAQVTVGIFHVTPRNLLTDLDSGSDLTIHLSVNFDSLPSASESDALPFPPSHTIRVSRNARTLGRVNVPKTYRKEVTQQYLRMTDVYSDELLAIEVPLATALASDSFELTWQGRVRWSSGVIRVQTPGLKTVQLPRHEFIDVIGSSAQVSYVVTSNTGEPFNSLPLTVSVDANPLELIPPQIHGHDITVQYTGQSSRHTVVVSAFASGERAWRSEPERMPDNPNYWLTVTIPDAWYDGHIGRQVYINYSVSLNDGSTPALMFSRYLRVVLS